MLYFISLYIFSISIHMAFYYASYNIYSMFRIHENYTGYKSDVFKCILKEHMKFIRNNYELYFYVVKANFVLRVCKMILLR